MKSLAAGILLLTIHGVAHATPVVSFTGFSNGGSGGATEGWAFNVTSPVTVTHLGYFDLDGLGLAESHQVGIWNSSGVLLTSATVLSGTTAPLDANNLFRLVDITDIVLAVGTEYKIGATVIRNTGDRMAWNLSGQTFHPSITYVRYQFNHTSATTLNFPTASNSNINLGVFGPGFEIAPVPEPSVLALLGAAVAALLAGRRVC